jgi:HAMP domain-containing protein
MEQLLIENNGDALTVALVLAVTAPTEEQSKEAERMAQQIASGMTAKEVDLSKKAAEVVLETQQGG